MDHSVIQQNTAWWLLGQDPAERPIRDSSSSAVLSGLGTSEEDPSRGGESRMELPKSGGGGGGVRGRLSRHGVSEVNVR